MRACLLVTHRWLGIVGAIVPRPNDFRSLHDLDARRLAFQARYMSSALRACQTLTVSRDVHPTRPDRPARSDALRGSPRSRLRITSPQLRTLY